MSIKEGLKALMRSLFERGRLASSVTPVTSQRPDVLPMNAGSPSWGTALHPTLLWWRERWVGILFDDVMTGSLRLGPRLALQLSAFYPPIIVEPISRLGPMQLPGMLGGWFSGHEVRTGDGAFDADMAAVSPCPAFAHALLDPEGRALVRRLCLAGAWGVSLSGRSVVLLFGGLRSAPEVLDMFSAVEAWLAHLCHLPPMSPPPEGLCHLCGCELRGVPERCATCGGRFHHHCLLTYGGCPLYPCATAERLVGGIIRFTRTGLSWGGAAETGPARPEHFARPRFA